MNDTVVLVTVGVATAALVFLAVTLFRWLKTKAIERDFRGRENKAIERDFKKVFAMTSKER